MYIYIYMIYFILFRFDVFKWAFKSLKNMSGPHSCEASAAVLRPSVTAFCLSTSSPWTWAPGTSGPRHSGAMCGCEGSKSLALKMDNPDIQ